MALLFQASMWHMTGQRPTKASRKCTIMRLSHETLWNGSSGSAAATGVAVGGSNVKGRRKRRSWGLQFSGETDGQAFLGCVVRDLGRDGWPRFHELDAGHGAVRRLQGLPALRG